MSSSRTSTRILLSSPSTFSCESLFICPYCIPRAVPALASPFGLAEMSQWRQYIILYPMLSSADPISGGRPAGLGDYPHVILSKPVIDLEQIRQSYGGSGCRNRPRK